MNTKWTEKEKNFIIENAGIKTDKELAEILTQMSERKVTMYAVRKMRQLLGVKKASGRGICALRDDSGEV